jgi:hypothetical protein
MQTNTEPFVWQNGLFVLGALGAPAGTLVSVILLANLTQTRHYCDADEIL